MDAKVEPPPAGAPSRALVVDDEATNRLLLRSILGKAGFEVVEAADGQQAVEQFERDRPDIVFMDAMMPVMDGFEATSRIKAIAGDDFVPVIFLTALTDKESLVRCIDAGGDDFLTKPISATLLKAKIRALERIRDLQREIRGLYARMLHDEEVAESIFKQIVERRNPRIEGPRYHVSPAGLFSGDMCLMERTPAGDVNILLADVTGHGLSAALAAMPASDTFRALSRKGFSPEQIVAQINEKLCRSLPGGMFMAAQFISIGSEPGRIAFANCGMPDALLVEEGSRRIRQRLTSTTIPLGITRHFDAAEAIQYIRAEPGDRLLLISDGVVEACDPDGTPFGEARFEEAVTSSRDSMLDAVLEALAGFCREAPQSDDISVVEIPLDCVAQTEGSAPLERRKEVVAEPAPVVEEGQELFRVAMTFRGEVLAKADPVPMILGQINEVIDLGDHKNVLYTIVSELYNNALDHGILGLDSAGKQDAEGFAEYYARREALLHELTEGHVAVQVRVVGRPEGKEVVIEVEDSGEGFDHGSRPRVSMSDEELLSRRGIPLVRELCDRLGYKGRGNVVEAVYSWRDQEEGE